MANQQQQQQIDVQDLFALIGELTVQVRIANTKIADFQAKIKEKDQEIEKLKCNEDKKEKKKGG